MIPVPSICTRVDGPTMTWAPPMKALIVITTSWAANFARLGYRIDLVDEHLALDNAGNGRGFVTCLLHWKHVADFLGLAPTGREGTSIETMIFTIDNGLITRIDVASNTTDLVIYEYERGWPMPHNVRVDPIVAGVDRREQIAAAA